MASQRDVRNRVSSVKNIETITSAMAMVAAARLRRAEQRIQALRPYASGIRLMTRRAAEVAGDVQGVPLLSEHAEVRTVGILLVAGDRGLAGAFNSNIVRAGIAAGKEHEAAGRRVVYFASGRRGASALNFRGLPVLESFMGYTDRPSYDDAKRIGRRVVAGFLDNEVDQGEVFYNGYRSAVVQIVQRETLLPLAKATVSDAGTSEGEAATEAAGPRARPEYEPGAIDVLKRLVPDYVEISIYRALL